MEIIYAIFFVILFFIVAFITAETYKYFKTMLRYKNRKKDGSEDKDFKKFD